MSTKRITAWENYTDTQEDVLKQRDAGKCTLEQCEVLLQNARNKYENIRRREDDMYKENLLVQVKDVAKQHGGKVRVTGEGHQRRVSLKSREGQICMVWYPVSARTNDLEILDLKDACQWVFGVEPYRKGSEKKS